MSSKLALRILAIGLFAGTLDIAEALIFNEWRGITPTRVLQYIASGVLGTASFRGGPASAGLGLALHYLIALSLRIDSDMRPPRALSTAHFDRNESHAIYGTGH
jgi:hypothetical protein